MLRLKNFSQNKSGFTLLEVVIAMAILMMAFGAILAVEGAALQGMTRAKQLQTVVMLAQNQMIETEFLITNKSLEELETEKTGKFEKPYEDYSWKRSIQELPFPNVINETKENEGIDSMTEVVLQRITEGFSKALREVTVTISWDRGSGPQEYSLTTYWINLNYEFNFIP